MRFVSSPLGGINSSLVWLSDTFLSVLPNNPPELNFYTVYNSFDFGFIGSAIIYDIVQISIFALTVLIVVRAWQLLPLT